MVLNKEIILKKLKEVQPILQEKYSVKRIGLFGSFAHNSANKNSDIDLLLELENPIGWDFLFLELFLEKTFNRKIDLILKEKINPIFEEEVLSEVVYYGKLEKETR